MREVEITLYLRDELLAYAMDRRARGLPHGPSDHFFGTATGRRRDPDRFRDRILARAVARADANRAEIALAPLPPITPRSLRRTSATFCAMIGRDPPLHRRTGCVGTDAVCRRTRRAPAEPPEHATAARRRADPRGSSRASSTGASSA